MTLSVFTDINVLRTFISVNIEHFIISLHLFFLDNYYIDLYMRPQDAYTGHIGFILSKAANYISTRLLDLAQPIVTIDIIESIVKEMYAPENRKGLFLRGDKPSIRDFKKYSKQLISLKKLEPTARYGVYKVIGEEPLSAQEMISLADPYVYVAYLSAMQRWNLTNRLPKVSLFARPNKSIVKSLKPELEKVGNFNSELPIRTPVGHHSLHRILQGSMVDKIRVIETKYPARTMWLGGEHTRISTQASTFVDMLHRPDLCGGMAHVIETWENYVVDRKVETDLVEIIDDSKSSILKVRAGYLLSERIGIKNNKIEGWKKYAARGGSRKLDADKPYKNVFSEEWMLSINV